MATANTQHHQFVGVLWCFASPSKLKYYLLDSVFWLDQRSGRVSYRSSLSQVFQSMFQLGRPFNLFIILHTKKYKSIPNHLIIIKITNNHLLITQKTQCLYSFSALSTPQTFFHHTPNNLDFLLRQTAAPARSAP